MVFFMYCFFLLVLIFLLLLPALSMYTCVWLPHIFFLNTHLHSFTYTFHSFRIILYIYDIHIMYSFSIKKSIIYIYQIHIFKSI